MSHTDEVEGKKVYINFCGYDDLLTLATVGKVTADRIWELRKEGNITPEILAQVPFIRMHAIQKYIDYTPLDEFQFQEVDDLKDFDDQYTLESNSEEEEHRFETQEGLLGPDVFRKSLTGSADRKSTEFSTGIKYSKLTANLPYQDLNKVLFNASKTVEPGTKWPGIDSDKRKPQLNQVSISPPTQSIGIPHKKRKIAKAHLNKWTPSQEEGKRTPVTWQQEQDLWNVTSANSNKFECFTPTRSIYPPESMPRCKPPMMSSVSTPQMPFESQTHSAVAPTHHGLGYKTTVGPTAMTTQTPLLKALKFDGTDKGDDWVSFIGKFEMYAEMAGLSDQQKRAQLCWSVTGTAARYCLGRVRRDKNIQYSDLVRCMEKRFNLKKLPETIRIQFQSARQFPGEDLDEWAERLLNLADKAFTDLPEDYVVSEVITKLCHGCSDKNAGSVAASFKPKTVDEALERIKWQQYNNKAVFGSTVRTRELRDTVEASGDTDGDDAAVNIVATDSKDQLSKSIDKLSETMDKSLKIMQDQMSKMEKRWHSELDVVKETMSGWKRRSPGNRVYQDRKNLQCYKCKELGHIARDCGKTQNQEPKEMKTPLNRKGPDP